MIYYKIFTHGPLVDVGSYAPRDYMKIKANKKKDIIDIKFDKVHDTQDQKGWYERIENNGWRPISDKILTPFDSVEIRTAERRKKFHHDLIKRKKLTAAEKRNKKLKWLRKLYRDAKNAELIQENQPNMVDMYSNPFEEKRFLNYDDEEFDKEVNSLIEWCEDLDYDKYVANWSELATSNQPEIKKEELV